MNTGRCESGDCLGAALSGTGEVYLINTRFRDKAGYLACYGIDDYHKRLAKVAESGNAAALFEDEQHCANSLNQGEREAVVAWAKDGGLVLTEPYQLVIASTAILGAIGATQSEVVA